MSDFSEVPAYDELMQPLLDVLKQLGVPSTVVEIRQAVATYLHLSSTQLAVQHKPNSNDRRTKFEYNLAWACTYLKHIGYIKNSTRGLWELTEEGFNTSELDIRFIKRSVRATRTEQQNTIIPTIQFIPDQEKIDEIENPDEISSIHTEIQWMLLKLGQDLRLDIWIARNDRNRQFTGNRFDSQPRLLQKLPQRFDESTQRTVEHIDVLWFKGQALVAAFEIENSTNVYSGLLRFSDLVSMQPDIMTRLYIVAPEERRGKVQAEMNRPTFTKATNLAERCRYLSYTSLRQAVSVAEPLVSHLTYTFIDQYSEMAVSHSNNS